MREKIYILYMAGSGAGTHIIRSMMMELNSMGMVEPINQDMFWPRAAAAWRFPEENAIEKFSGEGSASNWTSFRAFCRKYGIEAGETRLTKERIFSIFEEIYFKDDGLPIFDFMGRYFSTVEDRWTQSHVDAIQELVLDYYRSGRSKIRLKFIVQVRNTMDHIVSLYERFQRKKSLTAIRQAVVSNMFNLERILPQLSKADHMYFKFEDIIGDLKVVSKGFNDVLELKVPSDFYLSDISLDKWMTCPAAYKFLSDKELLGISRRFSYTYKSLPGPMMFLYFLIGSCRREWREVKLVRDVVCGRVNAYNPVLNKHSKRGLLPRLYLVYLRFLRKDRFLKYRQHQAHYNELLAKHNKRTPDSAEMKEHQAAQ